MQQIRKDGNIIQLLHKEFIRINKYYNDRYVQIIQLNYFTENRFMGYLVV